MVWRLKRRNFQVASPPFIMTGGQQVSLYWNDRALGISP